MVIYTSQKIIGVVQSTSAIFVWAIQWNYDMGFCSGHLLDISQNELQCKHSSVISPSNMTR